MPEQKRETRRLLKKTDLLWIGLLLAGSLAALLLLYQPWKAFAGYGKAQISWKGEVVRVINLTAEKDQVFTLTENPNVSFQIENHRIRFVNTDCPDKLCENCGYLEQANETAICLPNQVSLRIIASDPSGENFDAVL